MARSVSRVVAAASAGAVVMSSFLVAGVASSDVATAAVGDTIRGTIWQDYDSDGILDTFEDTGRLGGVEIRAYDGDGAVAGPVTTAPDGTYALPVTSDATRWRVEANVPDTAQWAGWEDTSFGRAGGTSHGTTTQFADVAPGVGAAGVDFSFQVPGAYVENNPYVFVPAFRYGQSDGVQAGEFATAAHEYDVTSPNSSTTVPTTMHVPYSQIGTTFGTAWQRAQAPGGTGAVFASAYVRRHSGLGPAGIDAIYRITPDTGQPTSSTASAQPFVNLADHGIDVGSDSDPGALPGDPDGLRPAVTAENPAYDWDRDAQAWDKVGRVGLGGMEISNDQRSLFVVNLHNRSLVEVEINRDGTQVLGVTEHELDAYFPDGGDLRPFGISSNPITNEMYLTVTDTAESTQRREDLHAYVYAFDPADPTNLREVLQFPLGYDRGLFANRISASYQPWSTRSADWLKFVDPGAYGGHDIMYTAVPMVADARYLHGDLIIGIRDLGGDLFGNQTPLAPDNSRSVVGRALGGELLKAGPSPTGDGTWTIENNGVVNGVTGAGVGASSDARGPLGAEKFFPDRWVNGIEHLGALLVVPSRDDGVLETGIHVANAGFQVGTRRFEQGSGAMATERGAAIIMGTNVPPSATLKGNGLGELTALASAAPIEIGNYVWYDVDHDGVQDPEENPVPGATVNLYEVAEDGSRTWVSSTTTSALGEYYFSSDPALNANGYALRTNTDYVVGIDNPADYDDPAGPLYGWYPTVADTGDAGSVEPDRNDSDGLVEESDEGVFPYAAITTGGTGENDHTIDFGYSQVDYEFTKRTVSGPTENPDDDGTWEVVYELVVENPSDVPGAYLLTDDLTGYGDGIEVVDTEVVSGPDGAILNTAWNGEGDQAVITERLPIGPGSTEDAGTAHVYTLRVAVALTTDATTGEATADPGQLACTPDQVPGDPTTGLFNVATLDPTGHEDIVDDECADLPLVTLDKTVEAEPAVVDRENEPGLWEVVYGLTVTNASDVDTDYDLTDRLRFGSAVEIESVTVENASPGGIATDEAFDGTTATQVVTDEPIAGGEVHQYLVTVRYRYDLPNPPAEPNPSDCSLVEGDEDGTGLLNGAATSFNGYPDTDSECRELGQPTHTKELVSATPVGEGRWQVVYDVTVSNKGTGATVYDLDDTLRYTDQATIVSAAVTGAPSGVTLAEPAWDGQDAVRIASNVPLLGTDDDGYAPHVYRLTVVAEVPLQLEGAGSGDETDPTACGAQDGDPLATALTNTSELTDEAGLTEDDAACAELPSIDVTKTVSQGPTPNGDGTWTVTYDIVASNDGAADGVYEVTDRMTADGDLEVVSAEVVTAPDGVTPSETWTGQGAEGAPENVIASGVTLPAGGTHTYQVEVVVSIDDADAAIVITPCSALGEGGNGGLSNAAGVEHNDLTDSAEACVTVAYVVVDKEVAEGPTPNGDGTWTIVYDIVAENVGAAAGDYEVTDRLHYGEGIEIVSAEVATAPEGVEVLGSWTGQGADGAPENVVATGVTLDGGATHTYQVEVVVEMDEAAIDPAVLECPPPGSGENGGLANSTSLDHNGVVDADDACASLPLIGIDKTISAGPTGNGDGTWTITYDLVATNTGQAEGVYDVADRLRYGTGVVVESAEVVTTPEGVTAGDSWTGEGAELDAPENLIAGGVTLEQGATHTYQVEVVVSVDEATVTPEALTCPEPGSGESGGLANSTALTHNGEGAADEACAPLPLIGIAKSISGAVTPVDGQDGVYDVVYDVTVTNRGPGAGVYDLDDELAPGEGVEVLGVQDVVTDATDPVGINPGFDGVTDTLVVDDQPIAAAAGAPVVHTYTVTVRYAADLSDVELPEGDACATDEGTVAGALNNVAAVGWNGITVTDDECVRPGKPTLDKALVSAAPVGDGRWEVVYDLTVGNVGTEPTTYDLDDELLFAPVITVDTVSVTGPQGVTVDEAFDGAENQRIATDVAIGGLDDDGYAPHVYRVTVVADVPLAFGSDEVEDDGTGSPACTVPAGSNLVAQGLNNAATLTDRTGGTVTDTDCAPVPSIDVAKRLVGEPVKGAGGAWTVTYEITATNDGAAEGVYDLTDRLRFGAGIDVTSATVTATPDGVTAAESWTGQGADGDAANVVATDVTLAPGATHTYEVQVAATVDQAAADASTWACPEPGSGEAGGFANTAGIGHNDLTDTAEACAGPDKPVVGGSDPLPRTGAVVGGILGAAALLLLLGLLALRVARRRTDG